MVAFLPLSLYVHIPWCVRKCPYCDFNSHVRGSDRQVEKEYQTALFHHLESWLPWIEGRPVQSIFFGGGTPSLMNGDWYHTVMERFSTLCSLSDGCEVTMEVNPGAIEHGSFADYRAAGINRLSFGVQTFNPQHLNALGRIHTCDDAVTAIMAAAEAGFDRINVDVMYGLPNQSVSQAVSDLDRALKMPISHLSWYNLTIEPNTVFYSRPPKGLPNDTKICEQEVEGRALLLESGYERYEVSAYAKTGEQCRHNLGYWRYHDYIGIGAGAHGKLSQPGSHSIYRFQATRLPEHFISSWTQPDGLKPALHVDAQDRPGEFMMNALRLTQGFSVAEFEAATFLTFNAIKPIVARLVQQGLLEYRTTDAEERRYYASEKGYNYLDSVVAEFV